jgi:hypothetical protein
VLAGSWVAALWAPQVVLITRLAGGVLILVPLFLDHMFPTDIYAYVTSLRLALGEVMDVLTTGAASVCGSCLAS